VSGSGADYLSDLGRNPILSGLDSAALAELVDGATMVSLGAEEVLFRRGEPADRLFVVTRGQVDLLLDDNSENRTRFESVATPRAVGLTCVIGGDVYAYSCEGSSPKTLLIALPAADFIAAVSASRRARHALMAEASGHLRRLVGQLSDFKLKDSVQRLAGYLIELSPARQGAAELVLPTEKQVVADHLGMKPETLSRALGRLYAMGLAHSADVATLRVPDLSRLRRLYLAGEDGLH
jgi:CRP-like cAMP-binding protein